MDVGALTRKNVRKGRIHELHHGGSAGPLYFRGFLGEIRSVDTRTRDSFWELNETQSVVEPQYVPPVPAVDVPLTATPIIETSPQINAK